MQNPVDIVENVIISYARRRKPITYMGLTQETDGLRPHRYWHDILMKLSRQSREKYGFDLSVLVVSKVTLIPGNGFYMALSGADLDMWNNDPHQYFNIKSTEIFDYFADNNIEDKLLFADQEIDFLK